jgi:clan AA aspartic protease
VDVVVRGPAGAERGVSAVVDTGFTGSLTLPAALVRELSLTYLIEQRAVPADGREVVVNVHEVTAIWDCRARQIPVLATGGTPLVGMALLNG